ncbi:MAG: SsrA-binding protein SmpB [Candidatus Sungbacteria bacterium]|nr:SsrA-binding protein SmpB [Candidatus Sungbacteria bacterium]
MKEATVNKRAYFDYEILDTYEAGIELFGFEAKSAQKGRANLVGSFAVIKNNEAWLLNASIPAYQPKNTPQDYNPERTRKLLLHKAQIKELIGKTQQKGLTLVSLKLYNKNGKIKVLLGLARHKKTRDKRETIKKREAEREIERAMKR